MAEYIKREDVEKAVVKIVYGDSGFNPGLDPLRKKYVQEALSDVNVPFIDIVHCKECIHNGSVDTDCPFGWKDKKFNMPNPNDYCSYGERKERDNG